MQPLVGLESVWWLELGAIFQMALENITHAAYFQKQVDELKEMVRREVFINLNAGGDGGFAHQLKLIDAIQRLRVAYHFEREIEEALECIHVAYHDHVIDDDDDDGHLYNVALGFRLLRQQWRNHIKGSGGL